MNFGALLQRLMDLSDIKTKQLADCISYDPSYISKWVNGSHLPSWRTVDELTHAIAQTIGTRIYEMQKQSELALMLERSVPLSSRQQVIFAVESSLSDSYMRTPNQAQIYADNLMRIDRGQQQTSIVVGHDEVIHRLSGIFKSIIGTSQSQLDLYANIHVTPLLSTLRKALFMIYTTALV